MMRKKKFLLSGMILLMFVLVTGCSSGQMTEEPATDVPAEIEQPTKPPTFTVAATAGIDEPTQQVEETEDSEDNDTEDVASAEWFTAVAAGGRRLP